MMPRRSHRPLVLLVGLLAGAGLLSDPWMADEGVLASQPARSLGVIFDADHSDFSDGDESAAKLKDAIVNAPSSRPEECRSDKTKFTVVTSLSQAKQDLEFVRQLEAARKKAIVDYLRGQGIHDDGYSVEFVRRNDGDRTVSVTYAPARDETPPALTIEPERKQVNRGEVVNFLLKASDVAVGWDTGVKSIQLLNKTAGGESVGASPTSWGHVARPCDAATKRRELRVAYTVPRNPPLLILFEGLAEDYQGNYGGARSVLTTGEFSGRYEWEYKSETHTGAAAGDTHTQTGVADFSLKPNDEGYLTGEMLGRVRIAFGGPCPPRVLSEGSFRAAMNAEYKTGRLVIPDNPQTDTVRYPRVKLCNDYNDEVDWVNTNYLGYLYEAFQRLQPQDDGSLKSHRPPTPEPTAGGETHSATYTLTVRRYRN